MSSNFAPPAIDTESIDQLRSVILDIGQSAFSENLIEFINSFCPFDSSLVMLYSDHRRPDVLLDRLSHAQRQNSADHYVSGAYLLDPFYTHAKEISAPSLMRMREIAPQDFDTSEYFVSYYKQSNVVDELNYLLPISDGRVFTIAFERSTRLDPFSKSEIEACARHLPIVSALITRHISVPGVELPKNDSDKEHQRLEAILQDFGADVLTPRECQVVQRMLSGHSASSIASILDISIETIRVHRRNIYEKLSISSLAELFALALRAIYSETTLT